MTDREKTGEIGYECKPLTDRLKKTKEGSTNSERSEKE